LNAKWNELSVSSGRDAASGRFRFITSESLPTAAMAASSVIERGSTRETFAGRSHNQQTTA
jgi:hypothetical protein